VLWIDHVIWASADLDATHLQFEQTMGLRSSPGGVHPEGTHNRIVLLRPPHYVELIAVHDRERNDMDPWGRALTACIERGGGLMGWAVGTDDIDAFGARTGAAVITGSIQQDDGTTGGWRIVDPPDDENGAIPSVIQYHGDAAARADRHAIDFALAEHPCGAEAISWVEVSCDEQRLSNWLGDDALPVRLTPGPAGLRRVGLDASDGREVVLE